MTVLLSNRINKEVETGRECLGEHMFHSGKKILPDSADVIYSLCLDSDVLDASSFEEWASDFGYDEDSRAAEKTYHACLEIALQLRNGLGEANLQRLKEAAQEY